MTNIGNLSLVRLLIPSNFQGILPIKNNPKSNFIKAEGSFKKLKNLAYRKRKCFGIDRIYHGNSCPNGFDSPFRIEESASIKFIFLFSKKEGKLSGFNQNEY